MERLLIVANRLPIIARMRDSAIGIERSSGGLATGLSAVHDSSDSLWIGWPGELPRLKSSLRAQLAGALADCRFVPVYLSRAEVRGYYDGISNGVLWPLFHYQLDQVPPDPTGWQSYEAANEKFADAVAEQYKPGDFVWIHDYQLLLVPELVRRRVPDARIGFFLHIPFPSSEVFAALPWRTEILDGMLGADLIGFHTPAYLRHFMTSLRRVLGAEGGLSVATASGRRVQLGVFPMGVDSREWAERAKTTEVTAAVAAIRREAAGRKLVVGIDRLDYTKGIPARLLAMERLFQLDPSLAERVRMIQVTVPSREGTEPYARFARRLDELVGRINSRYATTSSVPVHNLHRALCPEDVCALYRAADVMLVTPLRDGMNLVAKEFVASRDDEDGVLVLSEFAGVADEMGHALQINPYDLDGAARKLVEALTMPREDRRSRMRALRRRVASWSVHSWAESFLDELRTASRRVQEATAATQGRSVSALVESLGVARPLMIFVDYDGTLVPFADRPEGAVPDRELIGLLAELADRPDTSVHIVSGRSKSSLERWLGELPVGLHAEHGVWSRLRRDGPWTRSQDYPTAWKADVRRILEHYTHTTDGSFIEEKSATLGWHYRMSNRGLLGDEFADSRARELRALLAEILRDEAVEVFQGSKVVEVRPRGVNKGLIVRRVLAQGVPGAAVLAIGDDETDEDLFAALPVGAAAVRVGHGMTQAPYRVQDFAEVRRLLSSLSADARDAPDMVRIR